MEQFLWWVGFLPHKMVFFLKELFSRVDPGGSIVDLLPMFRSVSNMIQSFSSFGFGKVYNYEILWAICGNQMNYINLYHHFLTFNTLAMLLSMRWSFWEWFLQWGKSDEPSSKDRRKFCRRCRRRSGGWKKNPGDLRNHELNRCK